MMCVANKGHAEALRINCDVVRGDRKMIDITTAFFDILILAGFALLMFLITRIYKKITGKDLDFSKTSADFEKERQERDTGQKKAGLAERYLNDDKLTKRWQNAQDMKLANEGKLPVGNKEDRFHLTPSDRDVASESTKENNAENA